MPKRHRGLYRDIEEHKKWKQKAKNISYLLNTKQTSCTDEGGWDDHQFAIIPQDDR
jgi:phage regulator Rha-like protein